MAQGMKWASVCLCQAAPEANHRYLLSLLLKGGSWRASCICRPPGTCFLFIFPLNFHFFHLNHRLPPDLRSCWLRRSRPSPQLTLHHGTCSLSACCRRSCFPYVLSDNLSLCLSFCLSLSHPLPPSLSFTLTLTLSLSLSLSLSLIVYIIQKGADGKVCCSF